MPLSYSGWIRLRENLYLLLWKRLKKVKIEAFRDGFCLISLLWNCLEIFFNFIIWLLFASRINAFWASVIIDGSLDCFCGQDLCEILGLEQPILSM